MDLHVTFGEAITLATLLVGGVWQSAYLIARVSGLETRVNALTRAVEKFMDRPLLIRTHERDPNEE